ncbi:CAP domain-containing protein [Strongyloides ratti]|uniref:CAP domain-containing protein n=1 Tax=Strongyloides ratti TaxID=34506 RepID=A0A090LA09_STRRB|nr:CAP domain-containing protein [Strongyloides ratti]CEF66577.2 CAP domain-containing protein [Strongyloides ratti]
MKLLNIILLTLSYATLLDGGYFIVIPFRQLMLKGRSYFEYNKRQFESRKQMVDSILLDHRYIPKQILLLCPKGLIADNRTYLLKKISTYQLPYSSNTKTYTVSKSDVLIEEIPQVKSMKYECNKNIFPDYKSAVSYASDLIKYSKFRIPDRFLGPNDQSKAIWLTLWKSCCFACFSQNGYNVLRMNILNEINKRRRIKKIGPLALNKYLNLYAKKRAMETANLVLPSIRSNDEITDSISAPMATLIVKKWYDGSHTTNSLNNVGTTEHINAQKCSNSKYHKIGIGIFKKGTKLYIVLKFS